MTDLDKTATQKGFVKRWVWGNYSRMAVWVSIVGLILDQVTKTWLLFGFDLAAAGRVAVLPILDIVLVWNRGISYGLFQQDSDLGRWLLAFFTLVIAICIWIWSVRSSQQFVVLCLALILGGAIGNGIDRLIYGAVVDFVHFHVGDFSWYVFNLADVWIVAGVAGLLYDSFTGGRNSAAK